MLVFGRTLVKNSVERERRQTDTERETERGGEEDRLDLMMVKMEQKRAN